jgi:hypothetical protein
VAPSSRDFLLLSSRFRPAVQHRRRRTLQRVLADAVPYTGHTIEGRRVTLQVRGRTVVAVTATVARYPCETFGDVGPLHVRETGRAAIGRDGTFRLTAGEPAQRVTLTGRLRRAGTVAGTLRVHGTIATGQRCASATLRYTAHR